MPSNMLADLTAKKKKKSLQNSNLNSGQIFPPPPNFWLNLTVLLHLAGRLSTVSKVNLWLVTFYGFFKGTTDTCTLSVSF